MGLPLQGLNSELPQSRILVPTPLPQVFLSHEPWKMKKGRVCWDALQGSHFPAACSQPDLPAPVIHPRGSPGPSVPRLWTHQ